MSTPRALTFRDLSAHLDRGEMFVLEPLGKTGLPHVLIDCRLGNGAVEIGLVDARRIRDWLTRYIATAEKHRSRDGVSE